MKAAAALEGHSIASSSSLPIRYMSDAVVKHLSKRNKVSLSICVMEGIPHESIHD